MAFMLRSFGHGTDASSPNRFVPKGSRPVTKRKRQKHQAGERFFFHGKNILKQLLKQRRKEKEPQSTGFFSNQIERQNYQLSIISLDSKKKEGTTDTVFQPFSSDLHHSTSWWLQSPGYGLLFVVCLCWRELSYYWRSCNHHGAFR